MSKLEKFREPNNVFPAHLTAAEQDIFALTLCEISKVVGGNKLAIKSERALSPIPSVFEFDEKQLIELFKCSKSNIRKTLEPAAKKLQARTVGYSDKKGFDYFSPIARVEYQQGGLFRLEMLPSVANMIADQIEVGFSEVDLRLFVLLSGRYERRILKLLSQWKTKPNKEIKFTIEQYRAAIGVPEGKYNRFPHLREKCIEQPFKDIIDKSSGVWVATDDDGKGYELIKVGRTYTHIVFRMRFNDPRMLEQQGRERLKQVALASMSPEDYDKHIQLVNLMLDSGMRERLTDEEIIKYEAVCDALAITINTKLTAG